MKKNRLLVLLGVLLTLLGGSFFSGSADRQSNGVTYDTYLPVVAKPYKPLWIGPDGGTIVALAIAPSNSQIMYTGTWGAGVYRSADGGVTWTQVNNGLPNLQVYSLAVDPINPNIVYTGLYHYKLYKTTDGGAHWVEASSGIQAGAIVYSIAIDPSNRNRVYIATRGFSVKIDENHTNWNGRIYRSLNAGANWDLSLENIGGKDGQDWAYSLAVNPLYPNEIVAAFHEYGVYKSTQSGAYGSWNTSNKGIDLIDGKRKARAIAYNPQYPLNLFLGVWDDRVTYVSGDGAGSWRLENIGDFGENRPKIYAVEVDPTISNRTYLGVLGGTEGKFGVLKSTDSSYDWHYAGLQDDPIWTVVVDPDSSNIVFAGTQFDGLYRSTNSTASWSHSHAGIINTWIDDIVVMPDAVPSIYTVIHENRVERQSGEGQPWEAFDEPGEPDFVHALVRRPESNRLFALTDQDGLYAFTHPGGPWQKVFSPLADAYVPAVYPDLKFETRFELEVEVDPTLERDSLLPLAVDASVRMRAMAIAPSNPNIAYLGVDAQGSSQKAVHRSSTGGESWPTATNLSNTNVTALAVSPQDAYIVYAATTIYVNPNEIPPPDVVYYTTNGGTNWSPVTPPVLEVYALAFSPTDAHRVYAGTDNGVYVREGGGPWTYLGFAGMKILSLATHPAKAGVVYAGTEQGVQVSFNAGLNWSNALTELSGDTILSIAFDPVDPHYIYFGTQVRGIVKMYYYW